MSSCRLASKCLKFDSFLVNIQHCSAAQRGLLLPPTQLKANWSQITGWS